MPVLWVVKEAGVLELVSPDSGSCAQRGMPLSPDWPTRLQGRSLCLCTRWCVRAADVTWTLLYLGS